MQARPGQPMPAESAAKPYPPFYLTPTAATSDNTRSSDRDVDDLPCSHRSYVIAMPHEPDNPIDFASLTLLVLDVDGVLTDGSIGYSAGGDELKMFHVRDGSGMKYWKRAGGKLAIITGRSSVVVDRRAEELGVDAVRQGAKNKAPVLQEVLAELNTPAEQAVVIGDDLTDLPMMHRVGFAACPADAVEEVRRQVDYCCQRPGGKGCVRELIELLLRRAGRWEQIMQRYEPTEGADA